MEIVTNSDSILYHFTFNSKFPNLVFSNDFEKRPTNVIGNEVSILLYYKPRYNEYVLRFRFEVLDMYNPIVSEETFHCDDICKMLDFVKLQWIPIVSQCYNEFVLFNSSFITLKFNNDRYFIGGIEYTDNFTPESRLSLYDKFYEMDSEFNWSQTIGR
jgi:hypothetical protein